MTDQQFAYMTRVIEASTTDGRFNPSDISRDEDFPLAMDAKAHDWIIIEAGNSHITQKGKDAWLAAKDERSQRAEASAKESKGRVKKKVAEVAFAIVLAVVTAIAGAIVTHWLQ